MWAKILVEHLYWHEVGEKSFHKLLVKSLGISGSNLWWVAFIQCVHMDAGVLSRFKASSELISLPLWMVAIGTLQFQTNTNHLEKQVANSFHQLYLYNQPQIPSKNDGTATLPPCFLCSTTRFRWTTIFQIFNFQVPTEINPPIRITRLGCRNLLRTWNSQEKSHTLW